MKEKELIDIRNKLYNSLPVGEIPETKVWDLLQMIKWHLNDLDNYIDRKSKVTIADIEGHKLSNNIETLKEEFAKQFFHYTPAIGYEVIKKEYQYPDCLSEWWIEHLGFKYLQSKL